MEARAPFRIVATSAEFCLAADEGGEQCESVQMIMGLVQADERRLLLSWGANDCEAKLGYLAVARVERLLVPV